jgi:hypothetical protein
MENHQQQQWAHGVDLHSECAETAATTTTTTWLGLQERESLAPGKPGAWRNTNDNNNINSIHSLEHSGKGQNIVNSRYTSSSNSNNSSNNNNTKSITTLTVATAQPSSMPEQLE